MTWTDAQILRREIDADRQRYLLLRDALRLEAERMIEAISDKLEATLEAQRRAHREKTEAKLRQLEALTGVKA